MGLFKSLRGNHPDTIGGPPSSQNSTSTTSDKNHFDPSMSNDKSRALPSEQIGASSQYTVPGFPQGREAYTAPIGTPPPSSEPPPYHDWTVIPDNSLLPPPPTAGYEQPLNNNADANEADRAHDWCRYNPLVYPHQPTPAQTAAVHNGDVRIMKPPEYKGDLLMPGTGSWRGSTRPSMKDACLVTSSPLYFASTDSSVHTGRSKTIYFEVEILSMGYAGNQNESTVALGFCAMPYPTWRMPGWERASLAVHSDDGHRYINDTWGGKDFTAPFGAGDTVGVGMSFSVPESPPEYNVQSETTLVRNNVEVFFTRNGTKDGSWNLHEELDHETDRGIEGLDGLFDLYGAVGVFGGVEFAIKFRREEWIRRPR